MALFKPGMFARRRGTTPDASSGVGAVLAQAVESVADRLLEELREEAEAEREAEEQARLAASAEFVKERVRRGGGAYFPTIDD